MAERKATNDVIDLAAAVSSLVLSKNAGTAQQRRKLAQAKANNEKSAKKAASKKDDDDETSLGYPEETGADLEEYEGVNSDEEMNEQERAAGSSSGSKKCKRKRSFGSKPASPKGKAKAKAKAKSQAKDEAESIALVEGMFVETLPPHGPLSKLADQVVLLPVPEDKQTVLNVIEAGYSVKLRGMLVRLCSRKLSIASVSDEVKKHENEALRRYTSTKKQVADLFTEAMACAPFQDLVRRLGLMNKVSKC